VFDNPYWQRSLLLKRDRRGRCSSFHDSMSTRVVLHLRTTKKVYRPTDKRTDRETLLISARSYQLIPLPRNELKINKASISKFCCSYSSLHIVSTAGYSMHFYPRDAMLVRVFATATCLSMSVCPSVCHTPVLCLAERKQDREMYTI